MEADIIGLGTIVVDHLVMLPGYPEIDTKTDVVEDRFQVGGPVPTALVLLQRFGWRCSFIGSWADDPYGHMIEMDLKQEDVCFDYSVWRQAGRTGFAHVWVDETTGSRTIACYRPAEAIAPEEVEERALAGVKALHLDGWAGEAALKAAHIVRQNGGTVFLDTGSPKPGMDELIRNVDAVNCPRRFLTQFLEADDLHAGVAELLAMGPRIVTVTDGACGAAIATREGVVQRPAHVIDAADTTGADDVFCGGLIHGVLKGWPAADILDFATAAAGIKCKNVGNRAALPTLGELSEATGEWEPSSAGVST
ncbi:MAG: carbohydrate kinase family protein [Phycisphaeraceae bacterium]